MNVGARYVSGAILRFGHRSTARRKFACPNCQRTLVSQRAFASVSRRGAEADTPTSRKTPGGPGVFEDEESGTLEEQEARRKAAEAPFDRWDEILPPNYNEEVERGADQVNKTIPLSFTMKRPTDKTAGFWGGDEEDDELGRVDDEDEDWNSDDDITSVAHGELDLHRDMRQYQRRVAWDMPLLSKFAKPFEPPSAATPLRFRYTNYLGDIHPSESKVVVTFTPSDLQPGSLKTQTHVNKLIKLAGVRYDPSTTIIKMSCEKFESAAQNKRYLGDLVNALIAESVDPTKDTFEDVPFDFRHHKPKKNYEFPEEWKLGPGKEQRVKELVTGREERKLLAGQMKARGEEQVDGDEILKVYVAAQSGSNSLDSGTFMGGRQDRNGRQLNTSSRY